MKCWGGFCIRRLVSVEGGKVGVMKHVQTCLHLLGLPGEIVPVLRSNGEGGGKCNAQRVALDAANLEFIVKVRPGCQTGHADESNDISLADFIALV